MEHRSTHAGLARGDSVPVSRVLSGLLAFVVGLLVLGALAGTAQPVLAVALAGLAFALPIVLPFLAVAFVVHLLEG